MPCLLAVLAATPHDPYNTPAMRILRSWFMAAYLIVRYFLFRAGWVPRPDFTRYYDDYFVFCSHLLRWNRRLRIVGAERCPAAHPVVFAGNHVRLTDPLYFFGAIARASGMRLFVRFMARDDFFTHPLWRLCPLRMHDILEMGGAHFITRDNVKVSQLKPFFEILDRPGSFLMFPGRSRSRSGMVVEYREAIDEPGAVSFFLTHSQRHRPENPAVAVPLTRTCNPVTGNSVVVFGDPVQLPSCATKDEQRALDAVLAVQLGDLVEITVAHLACSLLYLWCLHERGPALSRPSLELACARILGQLGHRYVDPMAQGNLSDEMDRTLRHLWHAGMAEVRGGAILPDSARVLHSPGLDTSYRKANPVKFIANQILHFDDVVRLLNEEAEQLKNSPHA